MTPNLLKKLLIDTLTSTPPPNSIILSFDEKAKIAIKEYGGFVYTKEKKVKYPTKQKVKGLLIERVFSKFDKDVLQNSNFPSVRAAMERISNYFEKELSFRKWCS